MGQAADAEMTQSAETQRGHEVNGNNNHENRCREEMKSRQVRRGAFIVVFFVANAHSPSDLLRDPRYA